MHYYGVIFAALFMVGNAANFYDSEWEAFKTKYEKHYATPEDESYHRENFVNNLNTVLQHSNGDNSYQIGINQFSDLSKDDFASKYLSKPFSPSSDSVSGDYDIGKPLPESMDWRDKGVVLPVQNQGELGTSILINSLDCLSAYQVIHLNHTLVSLSKQQIYDCLKIKDKSFCEATNLVKPADIYTYVRESQGIENAKDYPFEGKCNECKYDKKKAAAFDNGWAYYQGGIEKEMQRLLLNGPVVVGVYAAVDSFMMYTSGIYSDPACKPNPIDHLMLLVGYGKDDGGEYWILRNSWGANWGEKGYMRLARNKGNLCGVASFATIPLVTAP